MYSIRHPESKKNVRVIYGEPDIFPGNWIRRSPIDEDNQEFDITRRDLEESQGVPYISIPSYDVEF